MEFLRKILNAATYDKIVAAMGTELAKEVSAKLNGFDIDAASEKLIPKEVFDQERDKVKALTASVSERDTQLSELTAKAKGNEELSAEIKRLQGDNKAKAEEYEQRIAKQSFDYALDKELSGAKARNTKSVSALLDMAKLQLKDGKIDGLTEQLEGIKKDNAFLFEEIAPNSGTGMPQNNPSGGGAPSVAFGFGKFN